jgi:hypothetical protein
MSVIKNCVVDLVRCRQLRTKRFLSRYLSIIVIEKSVSEK